MFMVLLGWFSVAEATRHKLALATTLGASTPGATADRARQSSVTRLAPDARTSQIEAFATSQFHLADAP